MEKISVKSHKISEFVQWLVRYIKVWVYKSHFLCTFCQILAHSRPGGEGDSEGVVDDKFKLDKEDILIEFLANCDLLWCKLHIQYSLGFGSVTW